VRRLLEGEIAGLAAERRTDEQLARLHASIDAMEGGLDREETYIAADIDFHLILAEATGNRFVVQLMHAIRDQLRAAFGTIFQVPGSPAASVAEHREIAAAVESGAGDVARALMTRHIDRVCAGYRSRLEAVRS
jgi:GntR family transcriptional repressor for pyruvate dehydrogenase complex